MRTYLSVLAMLFYSHSLFAQISGPAALCCSSTAYFSDAATGGTWSTTNSSIATITSSTGLLAGIHPGVDSVIYSSGTGADTFVITLTGPDLISMHTPTATCDSTLFAYAPVSDSAGVTFSWSRAYVAGIASVAGTGTGNIFENLVNSSNVPLEVTYVYTLTITASGCTNTVNVTDTVLPRPMLQSVRQVTICDTTQLNYTPTCTVSGTAFHWSRPAIAGISNPAGTGTGGISELLVDTAGTPVDVAYIFTMVANGCAATDTVIATVNPCGSLGAGWQVIDNAVRLFPDPAHEGFNVTLNNLSKSPFAVSVYDITGKKLQDISSVNQDIYVSTVGYAKGIYLCRITAGRNTFLRKVIID